MGDLARDVRALIQQVAALRTDIEQYRTDLRDALDRLLDQAYPVGHHRLLPTKPRPRHQHRSASQP